MSRLTFLVSLIPFALCSCWDFAALTDKGARDGGLVVDLYMCGTEINANREDCTNGIDDNQDCRIDCDDPQCKDFIKCIDPTDQLLGYGTRNAMTATCGANQTSTNIKQNLSLNSDCGSNNGCGCQANTAWQCTSTIRWADSQNNCNGNMFAGMSALTSGVAGNNCAVFAAPLPMNTSSFKVDTVTTVCPRDMTKNGNLQVTWGTEEKLCTNKGGCDTLDCAQRAGAKCLAFNGDWPTCPAAFPNKINTWFQSVTDNRTCACTCSSQAGSCGIAADGDALLYEMNNCTGAKVQTLRNNVNQCVAAALSGGNPAALSFAFQSRPQCAASGTASTDLPGEMQAGRVTLNNAVTTCCAP